MWRTPREDDQMDGKTRREGMKKKNDEKNLKVLITMMTRTRKYCKVGEMAGKKKKKKSNRSA